MGTFTYSLPPDCSLKSYKSAIVWVFWVFFFCFQAFLLHKKPQMHLPAHPWWTLASQEKPTLPFSSQLGKQQETCLETDFEVVQSSTGTTVGLLGRLPQAENLQGRILGWTEHYLPALSLLSLLRVQQSIPVPLRATQPFALLPRASDETLRVSWELLLLPGNGRHFLPLSSPPVPSCHIWGWSEDGVKWFIHPSWWKGGLVEESYKWTKILPARICEAS